MFIQNIIFQPDTANYLCTVCLNENSGGKIALTIIISSLILLGLANWVWKKYFSNKKQISQQK